MTSKNFHGLFTWIDWDEGGGDSRDILFYDVTFLIPMGKYSAGDEVDSAYWKTDELTLFIGDDTVGIKFGLVPIF